MPRRAVQHSYRLPKDKWATEGMTEDEIAIKVGTYEYIKENEITEARAIDQLEFIMEEYEDFFPRKPGYGPIVFLCGCRNKKKFSGYKTTCNCNTECTNYNQNVICPRECGERCVNNPYVKELFCIDKKKCFVVHQDNKGWGLFAAVRIASGELIGEFTGVIGDDESTVPMEHLNYTMGFHSTFKQFVNPYEKGSACRLLNHSCVPNCLQRVCMYEFKLRIMIQARQVILIGEELTIDYGWKHEPNVPLPICYCGAKACKGYIGSHKTHSASSTTSLTDIPHTPIVGQIQEKKRETNEIKDMPRHRPYGFLEQHVFVSGEFIFMIIASGNLTRVVGGIVTHCYMNQHEISIVVLRTRVSDTTDVVHAPALLCFHFQEEACYTVQHLLSDNDKKSISEYFQSPESPSISAQTTKTDIATDFKRKVHKDSRMSGVAISRSTTIGPVAVGCPTQVLRPMLKPKRISVRHQANQTTSADVTRRNLFLAGTGNRSHESVPENDRALINDIASAVVGPPSTQNLQQIEQSPTNGQRTTESQRCQPSTESTDDERAQDEFDEEDQVDMEKPAISFVDTLNVNDDYDQYCHAAFANVKNKLSEDVPLFAMVQEASLTLAGLATGRRRRTDTGMEDDYEHFHKFLMWYYVKIQPSNRRYLVYNHYLAATEVFVPGSISLCWCSLCAMLNTFESEAMRVKHFEECHAIVGETYKCDKCRIEYDLPSTYIKHLEQRHTDDLVYVRLDVDLHHMDALADYRRNQTLNGESSVFFRPGIVSTRNPHEGKSENLPVVEMDLKTHRPANGQSRDKLPPGLHCKTVLIKDWPPVRGNVNNGADVGADTLSPQPSTSTGITKAKPANVPPRQDRKCSGKKTKATEALVERICRNKKADKKKTPPPAQCKDREQASDDDDETDSGED